MTLSEKLLTMRENTKNLKVFKKESPNLIITDIKMPHMSNTFIKIILQF